MTTVKLYEPDIRVTLFKTIDRSSLTDGVPVSARYQGTARRIDLTPYLSETAGMRVTKGVREPAGGFTMTLADKPYSSGLGVDSLYGIIEPMDFIEIRMRHEADTTSAGGGGPPVVMRGFVSRVQRAEAMGVDGRPMRAVTVVGQDYGKLWQMLQILYLPGYVIGQDTLSNFKLFERFGVGFQTAMKASDFVQQVIEKIVNPYLDNLMPADSPNPRALKLDISVKHGTASVTGPQNQEGTFYNLLRTYGDVGIWNELYLEDREDGVYCVYRPNPAKDVQGKLIDSDAAEPTVIDLSDTDVISMMVERSDANVANFYWVRAPRFDLVSEQYRKLFAITGDTSTVLLDSYQNTQSKLYGTRVMYAETQQGGDDVTTFNSGQTEADQTKRDTSQGNWINDRRKIMVDQNKDNILLESGVMRVRGNETIRAGTFVRLRRGSFAAEYYVVQVDHDYIPFQGFFSTLTVERGMGYVARAQREGGSDSPYYAEMSTQ